MQKLEFRPIYFDLSRARTLTLGLAKDRNRPRYGLQRVGAEGLESLYPHLYVHI